MASLPSLDRAVTPLSAAALATFARDFEARGGAMLDFSADAQVLALCDQVTAEAERLAGTGFDRIQNLWQRGAAARALAGLPVVMAVLAEVYGRAPFPFQTLNFHYGSQQKTHSDMIHFTPDPAHLMCGVWWALEDVHPQAGPVTYYPGSHKLPVMSLIDAGAPAGMDPQEAYRTYYEPAMAAQIKAAGIAPEPALLKKGQAFVWAANLAHGGAPRQDTARTRRSMVTHYFFEGCQYYTLMHSGDGKGRRALRAPLDARTNRIVWPRRAGQRPNWRAMAGAVYARLTQRMIVFRGGRL